MMVALMIELLRRDLEPAQRLAKSSIELTDKFSKLLLLSYVESFCAKQRSAITHASE